MTYKAILQNKKGLTFPVVFQSDSNNKSLLLITVEKKKKEHSFLKDYEIVSIDVYKTKNASVNLLSYKK